MAISTPYDTANPFNLGTMALNADGTSLQAAAAFPNAGDHLTITDTRAGNQAWTAYITATDFTDGGSGVIDATGLAYSSVTPSYISGNALNPANPVVTNDVPSVKGGPHQFASAAHGTGSVYIDGALALTAPTSTTAGLYTATVTFTVFVTESAATDKERGASEYSLAPRSVHTRTLEQRIRLLVCQGWHCHWYRSVHPRLIGESPFLKPSLVSRSSQVHG